MTREEFIEEYCQRSGISWEDLSKCREPIPCACGDELCKGWAMVSVDPPLCDEDYGRYGLELDPYSERARAENVTKPGKNTND